MGVTGVFEALIEVKEVFDKFSWQNEYRISLLYFK